MLGLIMVDIDQINPTHLWYVVGLIATDGNLSKDGRHINITSKDKEYLEDIRLKLGLTNKLGVKASGKKPESKCHYLQFGSVSLYRFLLSVGLTPRKSLTMGKLFIPKKYFSDFFRGVIDGDGSIYFWKHASNHHIQWNLSVTSAAPIFIKWLKVNTETIFKVRGKLYEKRSFPNPVYTLRFGKLAGKVIIKECYYTNCLCLKRKLVIVNQCLQTTNGLSKYGNVIHARVV